MSAVSQVRNNCFEACCRLCLCTSDDRTLIDVFTVNNLSTIIRDMFNINITPVDKCTTRICTTCLADTYDFNRKNNKYLQEKSRVLKNFELLSRKPGENLDSPSTSKTAGCVDSTTVENISPIAHHACSWQESTASSKRLSQYGKNEKSRNANVRTDQSNISSKTKKSTSKLLVPGLKQSSRQEIQRSTQSSKNPETSERPPLANQTALIVTTEKTDFGKKVHNQAHRKRKSTNGSDETRTKAKARRRTTTESSSGTQLNRESENSVSFCVQSSGSGSLQKDSPQVIPKLKIIRVVGNYRQYRSSPSVENLSSVAKDMTPSESLSTHSIDNTREQNETYERGDPCAASVDDEDCDVMVESQCSITSSPAVDIMNRQQSTYGVIRVCRDLFESVEFAAIRNDLMIRNPLPVDDNSAVSNNGANSRPSPAMVTLPRRKSICCGINNQPTLTPNNVPLSSDPARLSAVPVVSSQMAVNASGCSVEAAPDQRAFATGTFALVARQPPPYQIYSDSGEPLHLPNYQLMQTGANTFTIQPDSTTTSGQQSTFLGRPPAAFNQQDPRLGFLLNSS